MAQMVGNDRNSNMPGRRDGSINPRTGKGYGTIGFGVTPKAASAIPNLGGGRSSGRGSSRSSGGSRGGGLSVGAPPSVGRTASGSIRPMAAAAPPKPPSLDQYLKGDQAYITQDSAIKRAMTDYLAQLNSQKQQYQGQYDLNAQELGKQRQTGFGDLENDYASRGLLQSGVYGKAYSDLENDFNRRQTDLDTGRSNFLANLATGQKNFQTEQQLVLEKARQDAIARRAAQYGI